MRKEVSVVLVIALLAALVVVFYYTGGRSTGYAVFGDYTNETDCDEIGGGYWYDSVCNEDEEEEETSSEEKEEEKPAPESKKIIIPKTSLSVSEISNLSLNPGSSQDVKLIVKNTGTNSLISCMVKPVGESDSWILASGEPAKIDSNKQHEFSFKVTAPEEKEEGHYSLGVSVKCSGIASTKNFIVNVEKKKLEFGLISADRVRSNRVRVIYSLEELAGEDQDIQIHFSLLDLENQEVAKASENRTLEMNLTKEFRINIPINESLEGELNLLVNYDSEVYSSSVTERVVLGAPIGGFAVFEGIGTGQAVVFLVVLFVLLLIFIFARRMRKKGRTLKGVFKSSSSSKE